MVKKESPVDQDHREHLVPRCSRLLGTLEPTRRPPGHLEKKAPKVKEEKRATQAPMASKVKKASGDSMELMGSQERKGCPDHPELG